MPCRVKGYRVVINGHKSLLTDDWLSVAQHEKNELHFFAIVVDLVRVTAVVFGLVDSLVRRLYFSLRSEETTPKEMTQYGRMCREKCV